MAENIFRMFGGERAPKKEFTPRDNSTLGMPRSGTGASMFPTRENSTVNKAEIKGQKTDDKFFSHNRSTAGARLDAMKVMGAKIKENSTLMNKMGIQGTEGVKKFVSKTTGKSSFYRAETARKDWEALDRGKVENTTFYKTLPESQQRALRNSREAQKKLRDVFGGMIGKK
jgi:hypothetical protein